MTRPCDLTLLRLGTRGSMLARTQSQQVATDLEKANPGVSVELVIRVSSGDQIQDRPLHEIGGKGLFTKELEEALLADEVDFAVHSFKDVPITMPLVDTTDLVIAAVPLREDPRDVLISLHAKSIADLPQGARVGTGSLRRQSQLLVARPDLKIELIRGNIDTRLKRLRDGHYDAIILAMAGLHRSGLYDESDMALIPLDEMLPSAGQGALAVQCRRDDDRTRDLLAKLDHPMTRACVELERAVVLALGGDCHSPIGALAMPDDDDCKSLALRARVGGRGGAGTFIGASASAPFTQRHTLPQQVTDALKEQGAERLLRGS